jgi:hypothetical protein
VRVARKQKSLALATIEQIVSLREIVDAQWSDTAVIICGHQRSGALVGEELRFDVRRGREVDGFHTRADGFDDPLDLVGAPTAELGSGVSEP